ncbi:MAG: ATP-dependent helicase, partial [Acidobacteria bacterium]|nr:ATP-dependent helicase [Acidobacteriota bacterium]
TKIETVNLAEKLDARGFSAAALNGDIPQKQREEIVDKLKKGGFDILVATDVVARGLDVERISHVVNYDIPYDAEAYVHRIGRTGRAGRTGEAILFVAPRERRMLQSIEKATRQSINPMVLPTAKSINERRISKLYERLDEIIRNEDLTGYQEILQGFIDEKAHTSELLAAAILNYAQ